MDLSLVKMPVCSGRRKADRVFEWLNACLSILALQPALAFDYK